MAFCQEVYLPETADRYLVLKEIIGPDMALYSMCAVFDVPYDPTVSAVTWDGYIRRINYRSGHGFDKGVTDPSKAKDEGMAQRERWERVWGLGNEGKPYTAADYRRMDEIFDTMTARRRASGGFDDQQEDVFRFCARTAHQRDKLMAMGDKDSINSAQKLDKMIQDNLAAENLRKKDEAPAQTARVDGIVEAMQRKYGKDITMTYDDVMDAFSKWMTEKHRYGMTQDAAEHSIMAIVNNIRINSDMPQITELPEDAKLDDFKNEFTPSAERREKEVFGYLQLGRRSKG